ncbi:MAG: methionine--tRNA ligase [Patescibacteria group bacterium]
MKITNATRTKLNIGTKYLVTTSWPYVNGAPHVGHIAGCYLPADIFNRYLRLKGQDTIFVSGGDMHGAPVQIQAESENKDPSEFAKTSNKIWDKTLKLFKIDYDLWTSTETKNHKATVQEIFLDLYKKGYIKKGLEKQPFCLNDKRFIPDRYVLGTCPNCDRENVRVGESCENCNSFITFGDIKDPRCKICGETPKLKETENFFFKLDNFEEKIKKYVKGNHQFRKNTIDFSLEYMKDGLLDRSITRDLNYGIPVPLKGYENKVIYVWFEAVIGYLSATKEYKKDSWKDYFSKKSRSGSRSIYFMAKDNIVFHTIIWPAILMGYNEELLLPTNIVANEYVLLEGEKMSKSNNHILPAEYLVSKYGSDQSRFYLTLNMPENKDLNFTWKEFITSVNSDLSSNIGNYINRTITFLYKNFHGGTIESHKIEDEQYIEETIDKVSLNIESFQFQSAVRNILEFSDHANKLFDDLKIWKSNSKEDIYILMQYVYALNIMLYPIIPDGAEKLSKILNIKISEFKYKRYSGKINKPYIIFPKIDTSNITLEEDKLS